MIDMAQDFKLSKRASVRTDFYAELCRVLLSPSITYHGDVFCEF